MMHFVGGACLSANVQDIVSGLIRALIMGNPVETLKHFFPKACESIEQILNVSESLLTDDKGNIELDWYLILFSELVRARGDALVMYKTMIMSVFHQCIHIINKKSYDNVAYAARLLLESLSQIYPTDYRLTVENIDEPFIDFLPIRVNYFL
jgi:hypothetical protein